MIFLINCVFNWPQIKKQTHNGICIITIIIRRIHNHLLPLEGGILTSKPLKQRTNVPIALPFPHPLNFIDFSLFSIVLAIVNALYINDSHFIYSPIFHDFHQICLLFPTPTTTLRSLTIHKHRIIVKPIAITVFFLSLSNFTISSSKIYDNKK